MLYIMLTQVLSPRSNNLQLEVKWRTLHTGILASCMYSGTGAQDVQNLGVRKTRGSGLTISYVGNSEHRPYKTSCDIERITSVPRLHSTRVRLRNPPIAFQEVYSAYSLGTHHKRYSFLVYQGDSEFGSHPIENAGFARLNGSLPN